MVLAMAVTCVALPLIQGQESGQSQGKNHAKKKDTKASSGTAEGSSVRTPMDPGSKSPTNDPGASSANRDGKDIKMPFGIGLRPAGNEEKAAPAADVPHWKVTDLGDRVRFEYSTPMGPNVWIKKKNELNDREKLALSNAAPPPAASGTPKSASSASGK